MPSCLVLANTLDRPVKTPAQMKMYQFCIDFVYKMCTKCILYTTSKMQFTICIQNMYNLYTNLLQNSIWNTLSGQRSARPPGTVGKASASEAGGPGLEPPWLIQRSRWESRPLSLVGNGAGTLTHPIDRKGSVLPRATGRFKFLV